MLGNALVRFAQHRLREIDADKSVSSRIVWQRDPGTDPDFENPPALLATSLFGDSDRGAPASIEHRAEHQVIDRCPSRIGALNAHFIDVCPHGEN